MGLFFESAFKAFVWLLIGVVFGLSSLLIIFTSNAIFQTPVDAKKIVDVNFVMILCIALMAGASADFLLSKSPAHIWLRVVLLFVVVFALVYVYILFNPNNSHPPKAVLVKWSAIVYGIFAFLFCMSTKCALFYHETVKPK